MILYMDFETRSYTDLKPAGAWAYSEGETTDVICLCWAIDNGPVQSWVPAILGGTDEIPDDLRQAIEDADEIEAHNVAFEISIWANVMVKKYGWPEIPLEKWRDSMAVAAYYSLPNALDKLAQVLGLGSKDPAGGRLITKYSKLYLKTAKFYIPPEDVIKFVDYCKQDVVLERGVGSILGSLPEPEERIFQHDLKVNMRGLYLDAEGIAAASAIVDERSEDLAAEFREITGLNPTQRDKIMAWCLNHGCPLENLQADSIKELLYGDPALPQGDVRTALDIRLRHSKASTKKLDAMSRQRSLGGRARFQTRYHGANTGRNTGSGFQPLNLSRGFEDVDPEDLVWAIMQGSARFLDMLYGGAMDAIGKASRHWIMAEEGYQIMAGDYVSIEAVVLACVAGEQWKIDAFTRGDPIYELMGCKIHNLPYSAVALALRDKKAFKSQFGPERQDGKTGELAFGYQGALGAWLKFDNSGRHTDERIQEICDAWRAEHPATTSFWRSAQDCAFKAIREPGLVASYRSLAFEMVDGWLTMILPSGKRLWYWDPQIRMQWPAWHRPKDPENYPECADGSCGHKKRETVTYMSQKEGQWRRVSSYGGKWTENYVQGISREIIKPAEMRLEVAGYPVILSVYDEAVCEVPLGFGSKEQFVELMTPIEEWAKGWPIRVDPWVGRRYKK
jgi:DNA polymerase